MNACPRPRSLTFLCAFALVALTMAGCGRVPGQFEILNDQIPNPGLVCSVPINPTVYMGEGLLDVAIVRTGAPSAYLLFPLIENNLPGSGAANDPNQIQITGFDVDISTIGSGTPAAMQVLNDNSQLLHFRVPWSGGVSSGGGQISAIVETVPVALAMQLAGAGGLGATPGLTLNLRVQAVGSTNSGRSLTSDPFNFPLEVCNGCLIGNVAPCPYRATNAGNACNPAQDLAVDCCTENGNLICPAAGGTTP
jgi:hypothetical protein